MRHRSEGGCIDPFWYGHFGNDLHCCRHSVVVHVGNFTTYVAFPETRQTLDLISNDNSVNE